MLLAVFSRPFRVENSVGVIVSVWLRGREYGHVEMMGSDVPGEDSEANGEGPVCQPMRLDFSL